MKTLQNLAKSLICLAILTFVTADANAQGAKEMLGKKELPSIIIQDLDGKQVNIAEYGKSGKVTVLNFWATWCVPCKKELTNIHQMYEQWQKDYDVQIVAISIDDARNRAKVKATAEGSGWDYIVLIDQNQELKRALNFQTVPYTLMLDKSGNVVYEHAGYVEGDEYELEDKIAEYSK